MTVWDLFDGKTQGQWTIIVNDGQMTRITLDLAPSTHYGRSGLHQI